MSERRHDEQHEQPASPTGVSQREDAAVLLEHVAARGVRFINLEFTDVVGMAKCVTISVEQLPDCLARGKWFDGSAMEGFARVAEADMYLRPDLATYAETPWHATLDQISRRARPRRSQPSGRFRHRARHHVHQGNRDRAARKR